ncbi:MAG: preprotein translocase subunit YajC [Propionibacteriaceae bacterium]|jgi:preprotein translocase subunit YajC|nr:preprotein translocase subunit YajC [Propionibacteriaceae bacterium]
MGWEMIGILVIFGVAMYFLMIRPAKKQQQKQQEMMNSLEVGSRVMLGSGIYGTIRHLGEKQAVIEISPGVDLTILRQAIRGAVAPDEEEFEYADEASQSPEADDANMQDFEADVAAVSQEDSPFAPSDNAGLPIDGAEPTTDTDTGAADTTGDSKDQDKK